MSQKVKEKKIVPIPAAEDLEKPVVTESLVSLHRYAGAALCSMKDKYKKVSLQHPDLKLYMG